MYCNSPIWTDGDGHFLFQNLGLGPGPHSTSAVMIVCVPLEIANAVKAIRNTTPPSSLVLASSAEAKYVVS